MRDCASLHCRSAIGGKRAPVGVYLRCTYISATRHIRLSTRPAQIRHLLRVTSATSRHPERDCLVLLLGLTCGMRVSKIAQLEVQDVLFPSGVIRSEVSLRAAITKGCRQRCVYLTHPKTVLALESYLSHRIARGMGPELTAERYRGLSPSTCPDPLWQGAQVCDEHQAAHQRGRGAD
ncbi:site-specific integrase [Paraburkholderia bannensis]|uniref:site-specific integrase n=1 Tax=Paraburkholderia bannensis TaxID=765414 RepID=UPI002ABD76B7|nr:site-specific integrase [Paraburkholderia bannensis]